MTEYSIEREIESAARALYNRDREEQRLPPKDFATAPERVKQGYREAVM